MMTSRPMWIFTLHWPARTSLNRENFEKSASSAHRYSPHKHPRLEPAWGRRATRSNAKSTKRLHRTGFSTLRFGPRSYRVENATRCAAGKSYGWQPAKPSAIFRLSPTTTQVYYTTGLSVAIKALTMRYKTLHCRTSSTPKPCQIGENHWRECC